MVKDCNSSDNYQASCNRIDKHYKTKTVKVENSTMTDHVSKKILFQ
jgi:hypothetical protein